MHRNSVGNAKRKRPLCRSTWKWNDDIKMGIGTYHNKTVIKHKGFEVPIMVTRISSSGI
jgi:hypothetical protein